MTREPAENTGPKHSPLKRLRYWILNRCQQHQVIKPELLPCVKSYHFARSLKPFLTSDHTLQDLPSHLNIVRNRPEDQKEFVSILSSHIFATQLQPSHPPQWPQQMHGPTSLRWTVYHNSCHHPPLYFCKLLLCRTNHSHRIIVHGGYTNIYICTDQCIYKGFRIYLLGKTYDSQSA